MRLLHLALALFVAVALVTAAAEKDGGAIARQDPNSGSTAQLRLQHGPTLTMPRLGDGAALDVAVAAGLEGQKVFSAEAIAIVKQVIRKTVQADRRVKCERRMAGLDDSGAPARFVCVPAPQPRTAFSCSCLLDRPVGCCSI